jgi:hypothetical protein
MQRAPPGPNALKELDPGGISAANSVRTELISRQQSAHSSATPTRAPYGQGFREVPCRRASAKQGTGMALLHASTARGCGLWRVADGCRATASREVRESAWKVFDEMGQSHRVIVLCKLVVWLDSRQAKSSIFTSLITILFPVTNK